MAQRRARKSPWTDDRDALELIARLLVSSSYRVPVEGTGTKSGLQAADVAGAVGYMRDRLAQTTALAVATRAQERDVARLSAMAFRRVVRVVRLIRPRPLDLHQPADRWRLRIAVYDAAYELVWPEHRRPYADLARDAKMRKASYIAVHKAASATLQEALNNGRRELAMRLFAERAT
ncbi:MAG: hypothetical protein HOQ02_10375 [Lysobacter sp.]|nr:hypothetical protein [Lysobacter sp.]